MVSIDRSYIPLKLGGIDSDSDSDCRDREEISSQSCESSFKGRENA